MRWLINYIRSCFCKHDYELLQQGDVYEYNFNTRQKEIIGCRWTYRCKKCGYVDIVNNY